MRFVRGALLAAAAALVAGCAPPPVVVAGSPAPLTPVPTSAPSTSQATRTAPPPASSTRPGPEPPTAYATFELAAHGVTVRVPVPVRWRTERTSLGYDFHDSTGTVLLRINVTAQPASETVRESWEDLERDLHLDGYKLLDARDVPGFFDGALDWSFLFDDDGSRRRVIDRLLVSGPARVAIYYSALQDDYGRLLPVWNRAIDGLTVS